MVDLFSISGTFQNARRLRRGQQLPESCQNGGGNPLQRVHGVSGNRGPGVLQLLPDQFQCCKGKLPTIMPLLMEDIECLFSPVSSGVY